MCIYIFAHTCTYAFAYAYYIHIVYANVNNHVHAHVCLLAPAGTHAAANVGGIATMHFFPVA